MWCDVRAFVQSELLLAPWKLEISLRDAAQLNPRFICFWFNVFFLPSLFHFYCIRFFSVRMCAKPKLGWRCRTIDKNGIISLASSGIVKWGALWARLPECTRLFALFQSVYWQIVLSRHHHYYCNIQALFIRLAIPHIHIHIHTHKHMNRLELHWFATNVCFASHALHTRWHEEQRLQAKKLPEN